MRRCVRGTFAFTATPSTASTGTSIPLTSDVHAYTRNEPLGVTGHIIAWNYPMQLLARAVAPAIATGNCSVAKPADETPAPPWPWLRSPRAPAFPPEYSTSSPASGAEAGAALSQHPACRPHRFRRIDPHRVGGRLTLPQSASHLPS